MVPSIDLPANGKCPRCGHHVMTVRYSPVENDRTKAIREFACGRCGYTQETIVSIE